MKQYLENIARYFTILALNLTLIATIPLQGIRYFNQADKNQKPAHIFNLLTIIFASINIFYSTIWGNITKHKNSYCLAITKYYNPIFYLLSCLVCVFSIIVTWIGGSTRNKSDSEVSLHVFGDDKDFRTQNMALSVAATILYFLAPIMMFFAGRGERTMGLTY